MVSCHKIENFFLLFPMTMPLNTSQGKNAKVSAHASTKDAGCMGGESPPNSRQMLIRWIAGKHTESSFLECPPPETFRNRLFYRSRKLRSSEIRPSAESRW